MKWGQLQVQIEYSTIASSTERGGLLPKISAHGQSVLAKLSSNATSISRSVEGQSAHTAFAHRIVAHYVKAFDFVPFFRSERDGEKRSEDYKPFSFRTRSELEAFTGLLNSSLFYFWFVTYSDVYHCGRELILDFPADIQALSRSSDLLQATLSLMQSYHDTAVRRAIRYKATGLVEYDEFYPRELKPQIDQVDIVLAHLFGLTAEQLDFVQSFDLKYRTTDEQAGND